MPKIEELIVAEIYQACVRGEVANTERLLIKAEQEAGQVEHGAEDGGT